MKLKFLTIFMCITTIMLANSNAYAQEAMATNTITGQDFNSISVSSDFTLTLNNSQSCMATWKVDEALKDFVEMNVKGGVLYIGLNKKGVKYIKKNYNLKNNQKPVLRITAEMPSIKTLSLSDESTINPDSEPMSAKQFNLNIKDKARVGFLKVNVSKDAVIDMADKANATLNILANNINVKAHNDATLVLNNDCKYLNLDLANSSSCGIATTSNQVDIYAKNSAKLNLKGSAHNIKCQAKGAANIDAMQFVTPDASLVIDGATIWINANKTLSLDLNSGSEVVFGGNPNINIVNVKKSNIIREENAKKRN